MTDARERLAIAFNRLLVAYDRDRDKDNLGWGDYALISAPTIAILEELRAEVAAQSPPPAECPSAIARQYGGVTPEHPVA